MTVCHVIVSRCSWVFALEAHCLEGRAVHRAAVSRYRAAEEAGSRVGCQGLALGEARCVGLCAGSGAMVHWLCEFGDAGNGTSCERKFNLGHRKCEDYRGTRFYNQDSALVIKTWLNRVEEDVSGLTFQEWTPDVDTSRTPVAMLINSSELRATGFKLKEVLRSASSST